MSNKTCFALFNFANLWFLEHPNKYMLVLLGLSIISIMAIRITDARMVFIGFTAVNFKVGWEPGDWMMWNHSAEYVCSETQN